MISLIELLSVFVFYTIITFGNGPVILPLLDQALVQQRGIITADQLLYAYAIARVTPGQVNLYISAIGFYLFGVTGAVLSLIAIILPGYLMVPMMHGYHKIKEIEVVQHLIKGVTVVSIGLILSTTVSIGQDVLIGWIPWIVFILVIVLTKVVKMNGFLSFVLASLLGVLLYYIV